MLDETEQRGRGRHQATGRLLRVQAIELAEQRGALAIEGPLEQRAGAWRGEVGGMSLSMAFSSHHIECFGPAYIANDQPNHRPDLSTLP